MTKWEKRNDFELNLEYTEKVLNRFDFNDYHFIYQNGTLSLMIVKNLKKYKIIINKLKQNFEVYRCEVHNSFAKHTKENFKLKVSFKDDCIWNSIKWVYRDCKVKG